MVGVGITMIDETTVMGTRRTDATTAAGTKIGEEGAEVVVAATRTSEMVLIHLVVSEMAITEVVVVAVAEKAVGLGGIKVGVHTSLWMMLEMAREVAIKTDLAVLTMIPRSRLWERDRMLLLMMMDWDRCIETMAPDSVGEYARSTAFREWNWFSPGLPCVHICTRLRRVEIDLYK